MLFYSSFIELSLPYFMNSIEVLMSSHYDDKADVFSFGVSLFEVLICTKPYSDNVDKTTNAFVFMQAIEKGMRPGPTISQPKDVMNLITSCWDADSKKRPSMKGVFENLESIIDNRLI